MCELVAFGCRARVGKDTAADYLVREYGFVHVAFADMLYDCAHVLQTRAGVAPVKSRALLRGLAALMKREFGDDVFARVVADKIDAIRRERPHARVVVSDLRFRAEADVLIARGFTLIKITRAGVDHEDTRIAGMDVPDELDGPDCDDLWNSVIANDGDVDALFAAVRAAVHATANPAQTYVN